jgi:hypothetical protein
MGAWTSPADLCAPDHECLVGANAAVLPSGMVLLYFYPPPGATNSRGVLLQPVTGAVTDVILPVARDIFCSGESIMPSGDVLVTGGILEGAKTGDSGTFNTTIFHPSTSTWSIGPNMNYARWYPSTVELADGTMLELSGQNETGTKTQRVMEVYNYRTNTWTVLPASADMPVSTLHTTAYPRMALLPSGRVFLPAPDTSTYQFDPSTNMWSFVATNNFGFRFYAPHVLLPGQEKVLVAGGTLVESPPGAATNTAEVIDFSASNPAWSYTSSMTYARINENLVLLADGTVLAVGGGGGGGSYVNPVLTPELYDPNTGTWTVMAPQIVPRTYHSTAVLLPDGRVLSAGSDDRGSMEQTYEIFSPPYLFGGHRPVITSTTPTSLTYGASLTITTPDAASITRVALIRPGATTHADDFDQRYVDLSFTAGSGQITAYAPASGSYAPPGYYMLVIVNSNGIPSVMPFVLLG